MDWAEKLNTDMLSANPDKVAELRARRCIFSLYALVCHSAGELTFDDVATILKLVMVAENSRIA